MQREIKKKTITYGVAAVLLVTILAASIYNFGVVDPTVPFFSSELKTFSSFEELENFISTNMETTNQNEKFSAFDGLTIAQRESGNALDSAAEVAPTASDDYSKTNIQVVGVDEADIVKTDGEYLYVVSESTIYILKAYPYNQARLVSKITLDQVYGAKIFVNGNKLVVVNDQPILYFAEPLARDLDDDEVVENAENGTTDSKPIIPEEDYLIPPAFYRNELSMKVYDITDKANPVLSRTVVLNGSLSGVRMIGDYVYMVTNQLATQSNPDKETGIDVVLPTIGGDHVTQVDPTRISYIDVPDQLYYITTVIAVDVTNDAVAPTYEAFLTTQTTSMYVSLTNMYLIAPNTSNWLFMDAENEVQEETLIYRIKLDQQNIVVEAEGKVEGFVVDQFSMDEYNGYFRVATTEWNNRWTEKEGFTSDSTNNLFVLDMNLDLVGKLENLAPDESIYATRFMDNRVYLVTFRQIDPFFVIDTSNPAQPTVLGYLKIPGYSSYLHIYDANHVIGVGKENSTLKLSLFDVTDVTAPIEKAKYTVEGDWSDSEALWDHKAFLFEKSKNLLALPVTTSTYSTTDIEDPVIRDKEDNTTIIERTEMITETSYFQGAYVFDISIEQGFVLKGTITHTDATNPYSGTQTIRRILYIEDVLYTVSDAMVALNNLESLAPLAEIALS